MVPSFDSSDQKRLGPVKLLVPVRYFSLVISLGRLGKVCCSDKLSGLVLVLQRSLSLDFCIYFHVGRSLSGWIQDFSYRLIKSLD